MSTQYQVDLVFGTAKVDSQLAAMERKLREVERLSQNAGGPDPFRNISTSAEKAEGRVSRLTGAIKGAIAAIAASQAIRFVFAKTAELEAQTASIQTLTGSLSKAKDIITQLQQYGAVTPFTSAQLIETARQLAAFGVETEKLVDTTKRLGDISGATGAELQGLALAYGQVMAKGRLQGEELLQFTERGVNLQAELQKMYGLSGEEMRKALEKGKVSAQAVEVAIVRLTSAGGKYAGGAISQSETLSGKMSTLTDNVETLARTLGTVLSPAIKQVLDQAIGATNAISTLLGSGMGENFQRRATIAMGKAQNFGALGAGGALSDVEGLVRDIANNPQQNQGGAKANMQGLQAARNVLRALPADAMTPAGLRAIEQLNTRITSLENLNREVILRTEPKAAGMPATPPMLPDRTSGRGSKGKGSQLIEHLHGDPNRRGYDRAGHGLESNAHDHFGFSDEAATRFVMKELQRQGVQVTRFGARSGHSRNSLHYRNQAFDVPWAQFGSGPIGERDFQQSRRVAAMVKDALEKFNGGKGMGGDELREVDRQLLQDAKELAKQREDGIRSSSRSAALARMDLDTARATTAEAKLRAQFDRDRAERMYRFTEQLSQAKSEEEKINLLRQQGVEATAAQVKLDQQLVELAKERMVALAKTQEAAMRPALDRIDEKRAMLQGGGAMEALRRQRAIGAMTGENGKVPADRAAALYDEEKALDRRIEQQEKLNSLVNEAGMGMRGFLEDMIRGTDAWQDSLARLLESLAGMLLQLGLDTLAGKDGGGLFSILNGTFGKSFDGGGFTGSGARAGGIDGRGGFPAILHPNETVIDHTRGQGVGGVNLGGIVVNVASDGSTQVDGAGGHALAKGIQAAVTAEIMRQRRPGGVLAG